MAKFQGPWRQKFQVHDLRESSNRLNLHVMWQRKQHSNKLKSNLIFIFDFPQYLVLHFQLQDEQKESQSTVERCIIHFV